ncbi:PQQ-dependent dehydrogenase, methanol/ethanol family [Sphingorhabdus sp. Alg239-R122]|uniref:PQQ-dependent dehydrogenase, methanol/ethanol family n=1 Tax=Sphingorhabdus sp. Alg239-R122 TaxID=2305989 RepID=UPI0013DA7AE9|nr:PQQ-dependent dehydrogenase, methanol/ethanol family [Sphingorhabdus sp. Alg239-R122]
MPSGRGILVGMMAAALALTGCEKVQQTQQERSETTTVDAAYLANPGDGKNWAATGYSYDERRYSPLTQINTDNVSELGIAWYADLPDARGQEATPVVVDGRMYISTAWSKVFAYDAKTGEELWSYDPEVPGETAAKACCDVVNRGVAFWKGKIYVGTLDGRLIALDALTGAQLWVSETTPEDGNYTITGTPRVVKNMVLIGNGGAEFGVRGYVSAYDANDGTLKWRFYTVPNPTGEADGAASDDVLQTARRTWSESGDWVESGGGGTVWDAIVYDHKLDQIYIGTGNGNPWNHGARSNGEGDNLFLSSIIALNPETGEYIWHYQQTPADSWDFTATQPIILADLTYEGVARKVLMQAPKNGFFFVLDRADGSLVSAEPFIDGINWATGYDLETGRPIENPDARYYRTGKPFLAMPSALGAHNWHPMSYSPDTGLVYIPAQQIAAAYLPPMNDLDKARKPIGFNTGASGEGFTLPDDRAAVKAAIAATTGRLVAINPVTGEIAWKVDQETPWNGGTMTTAGNLVFQGTALGQMRAYAADSGEQLWSYNVQSGVLGGASTYMVDGEQYIAFLTSKGGVYPLTIGEGGGAANAIPSIPRLIVMKLGSSAQLPALPATEPAEWNPPERIGGDAQVAQGRQLYMRYCSVCHGGGAVGGGVLPDLRRSGTLADKDTWDRVVLEGLLKQGGMISFAPVLSETESEAVRAYVIDRAHYGAEHSEAPAAE